jgi:hypothetical protein
MYIFLLLVKIKTDLSCHLEFLCECSKKGLCIQEEEGGVCWLLLLCFMIFYVQMLACSCLGDDYSC